MKVNAFHPFRSEMAKARYFAFEKKLVERWPVRSEELFVETSFGKTFMRISGPADGQPLVLVPGGGCCSLIWDANIAAFSHSYRTYALDNIYDFGRSVYTREMVKGKDYSDWLDEVFDALQLGSGARIIGYSYGGWVTSQYLLHHAERLSRVVLIAPVFTVLPLPNKYILGMLLTLLPVRYFKARAVYLAWADLAHQGDAGRRRVEERIAYYQLALKCFKFKRPVNPTVLTDEELRRIDVPVLFLVGEHETVYNARDAISRLNRMNTRIRTELLTGTGHDLIFTHTELVNQKILDFLKD